MNLLEILYAAVLSIWVYFVAFHLTKWLYNILKNKGLKDNVIVYFNRKIIHILAGGLVALLVPLIFTSYIIPLILGLLFALITYIPHRTGKLLYWFQDPNNYYEVNFCIMWAIIITIGWILFNNPWIAVVPVLFMAFGDATTGFVRNLIYKRRTKSWIGNIAMGIVSVPIGAIIGIAGIVAALISSIIEHFEFKYIDDNITIPLVSFIVIYLIGLFF
ncbi:MAG: dolichol kinase [Thermoproteota archaeon]|jgi:dolichol kinase|nr:dolichol kinase [Thermoproteota archaeon]